MPETCANRRAFDEETVVTIPYTCGAILASVVADLARDHERVVVADPLLGTPGVYTIRASGLRP
jgi:hypothetical protein